MAIFKKGFKKQSSSAKVDVAPKKATTNEPVRKGELKTLKGSTKVVESSKKKVAGKSSSKTTPKKAKHSVKETSTAYRVLLRPIITEKAANLATDNVYLFEVAKGANKVEVRNAVKALYGVTPRRVNIMNRQGKRVRMGRTSGKRKNTRNAFVYLPKGTHIDVYEGV